MKMKEKTKWYFLIAVALIVGAIIGYFATTNLSTTGNANNILIKTKNTPKIYATVICDCANGNSTIYYDVPGDSVDYITGTCAIACAGSEVISIDAIA